jgi:hypothetical protein
MASVTPSPLLHFASTKAPDAVSTGPFVLQPVGQPDMARRGRSAAMHSLPVGIAGRPATSTRLSHRPARCACAVVEKRLVPKSSSDTRWRQSITRVYLLRIAYPSARDLEPRRGKYLNKARVCSEGTVSAVLNMIKIARPSGSASWSHLSATLQARQSVRS